MQKLFALTLILATFAAHAADAPDIPRPTATLENQQISESSGIAESTIADGVFWTHNDSGHPPVIFAFNKKGEHLAAVRIAGAQAIDWEDIASFEFEGEHYLLIADTGGNRARKTLYVVKEPSVENPRASAKVEWRITFSFDGPVQDCEAVAVHPETETILLATKSPLPDCRVYELPLKPEREVVAKQIARLKIMAVTAMDISRDGRRVVLGTYGPCAEYERADEQSWADAFAGKPKFRKMPPRKQGEAICYGHDSRTLYLTSEGVPAPLWEVPPED